MNVKTFQTKMTQATNGAKKKLQDLKNSNDKNEIAIKVTNEDAKKQIDQVKKSLDSLKKQTSLSFDPNDTSGMTINGKKDDSKNSTSKATEDLKDSELNFDPNVFSGTISVASEKIAKEKSEIEKQMQELADKLDKTPKGAAYDELINKISILNRKAQGLPENIGKVNNSFPKDNSKVEVENNDQSAESNTVNIFGAIKNKIASIIPAVQQFKQSLRGTNTKELELVKYKISEIEEKLKKAQNGEIHLSSKELVEAEAQLERLNNKKDKLENKKGGNAFSGISNDSKKAESSMNRLSGVTVKIKNQIKQLGSSVKMGLGQILRYAGALFSLRGIYSLLSSSAQTWLSSQNAGAKQLSANIDYMKYAMGSALAPIIQFVTNLVYQLMKAIQSVAYALTGVNIFAKASASSYSSMAKSAGKAKDATKQLAGVHSEINNVQTNKSGSSGGAGTPSFNLSGLDNTPNSIIDAIKSGNWYEVGSIIGQKLNEAMDSIPWNKIQDGARKIGTNIAQFLNGFIATTNWNQVGNTFAQGLNTIIYFGYSFIATFNWGNFGQAIGNAINGFFQNVDWAVAGQTLSDGIKGILDIGITALKSFDPSAISNAIVEFITNVDWLGVAGKAIELALRALVEAFVVFPVQLGMAIGEKLKEGIDTAVQSVYGKIKENGGNVMLGLLEGIAEIGDNIGQWVVDHIFQPFIDGFKEIFGIHSPSTVMAEMGGYLIEGLKNGISDLWNKIKAPFVEFGNNVSSKFNEIKGKVTDWANNTKTTVSSWGNNVKSKVSECWTNASNTVRDKVNTLKTNISTGLNNARSTISGWGDNIKSTFTNLGRNAATWGKDLVDNMASGIRNNVQKVGSAVQGVASKIKGLLGFSEPEEGPLSNFHTYMPDMIDLMVEGIKSNTNRVKSEIEDLAGMMSYTINTDGIVDIPQINSKANAQEIKSRNSSYDSILSALSDMNSNDNNDRPIYLTIKVGDRILGEILLNDLRNKKRQTGKDIDAIIGD